MWADPGFETLQLTWKEMTFVPHTSLNGGMTVFRNELHWFGTLDADGESNKVTITHLKLTQGIWVRIIDDCETLVNLGVSPSRKTEINKVHVFSDGQERIHIGCYNIGYTWSPEQGYKKNKTANYSYYCGNSWIKGHFIAFFCDNGSSATAPYLWSEKENRFVVISYGDLKQYNLPLNSFPSLCHVVYLGGHLHSFSSCSNSNTYQERQKHYLYDELFSQRIEKETMPYVYTYDVPLFVHNEIVYFFGGYTPTRVYNLVKERYLLTAYDYKTDTYRFCNNSIEMNGYGGISELYLGHVDLCEYHDTLYLCTKNSMYTYSFAIENDVQPISKELVTKEFYAETLKQITNRLLTL